MTGPIYRRVAAIALCGLALLAPGCAAPKDPYATTAAAPEQLEYAGRAVAPDEPVDAPAPRQADTPVTVTAAPSSTPEQAARRFATRFVNWSWRDAAQQARDLAALSTGRLAARFAADARTTGDIAGLRQQKPSMQGSVEALTLTERNRRRTRALVVTREQSLSDARPDEGGLRWNVYLARLTHSPDGWTVSSWEAQP